MNVPQSQYFQTLLPEGKLQTTAYHKFAEVGDEIPMHEHEYSHSCCCAEGKCELYDDTGKSAILQKGQFADLKAFRKHAIKALEKDTVTIHVNEPGN